MSYNYRFEPPTQIDNPALEYGDNCHNCNEDCPGAYLICRGEVE